MSPPKARIAWAIAAALLAAAAAAAYALVGPRIGRVLPFTVTAVKDDGPSKAWEIVAEVSVDDGSTNDYAATAVAIASAVPHHNVVVSIERNDVAPSAGSWRRTLARAEHREAESPSWVVSTAEPPRSKNELAAAIEYTERVGLALTGEGEPLASDTDDALIKELAAKHGVDPFRVMTYTPLYRERWYRWGWIAREGPGSGQVEALARCFAEKARETNGWKACR